MIPERKYSAIIVAGGKGYRVGGELPKQFISVGGKPMLMHTIQAFHDYDYRVRITVVLPEGYMPLWKQLCEDYKFTVDHKTVYGGESRFHSVKNGLAEVSDEETVCIHDAARPFVTPDLIGRCFDEAFNNNCGVIPVVDEVNSVRRLTESGSVHVDRQELKIVQTPQAFPAVQLKAAYNTKYETTFTDDASVAEKSGMKIKLVEGEESNIKITTAFDVEFAEFYFQYLSKR
ncbi:MAG: 2-C-methyl-D-erythritol 4-phosphate cytidylyltransferase [Fermentimonas sp.]|nr:2-C-methyl-D-erythritol 4-phosphate cytidylyltransferase [Fermentimonas sp.]